MHPYRLDQRNVSQRVVRKALPLSKTPHVEGTKHLEHHSLAAIMVIIDSGKDHHECYN